MEVVVSDKVSYDNGKDWRYIIGYDVDMETIIPLFIKTSKNTFNYGLSRYDNNSPYAKSFNAFEDPG